MRDQCEVGGFLFKDCLEIVDPSDCEPRAAGTKIYAAGIGLVRDADLKVVSFGFVGRN